VTFISSIKRLVIGLALCGLIMVPLGNNAMATPAHTSGRMMLALADGGMAMPTDMAMSTDMPCCPHEMPTPMNCAKHCAFMAMCGGQALNVPIAAVVTNPGVLLAKISPDNDAWPRNHARRPPPRPPRILS
jgi:hypothetical protein